MAGAAEFRLKDISHFEMFGGLLFDVEDIRVAVGTVQELGVNRMGEDSCRDIEPTCLKLNLLFEV